MPGIIIRTAVPEDREVLSDLIAASYRILEVGGHYDPQLLADALPAMSRANPKLLASGTYYVAEDGGAAVGCGGWTREAPGTSEITEGVGHIRHFATHPDYLRKGIARMLLEYCIGQAAAAGMRLMQCHSTLPAEKFYARSGFTPVRQMQVEMAPGISLPAIEMERPLP